MTSVLTKTLIYTACAAAAGAIVGVAAAEPVKRIGRFAVNRVTSHCHTKTTETDTETAPGRTAPEPVAT